MDNIVKIKVQKEREIFKLEKDISIKNDEIK